MSVETPRDERFETPRNSARCGTDDFETPRSGRAFEYETPRSGREYGTPRDHYAEMKAGQEWQPEYKSGRHSIGSPYAAPRDHYAEVKACQELKPEYKSGRHSIGSPYEAKYNEDQYQTPCASSASAQGGLPYDSKDGGRYRCDGAKQDYREELQAKNGQQQVGHGAVDEQDVEEVFSSARHNRVAEVEAVLDRGVPINVRDRFGNTVLIVSCQNGHKRAAKMALRKGADINARNYKGNTALHFCYAYGYGDTLGAYLVSKGADDTVRNAVGLLPSQGIS